ncbi:MAG: Unknown protein [uncultured Thiotrichaceae bacterium]|uniref:Zinc/iron-chelating domain-containing protein n=1 Tax=uncultured Thiotrichaceae bacterium TaxID=298394 RepID=A0A6S6TX95_9GAMM|nr:MAG: Unknown protein [uncultured Thiotrichaceae bacterium]
MSYACTQCGLCCRNISNIEQLKDFNRGDGTCTYYRPHIGCTIYEKRPLACQIDAGYQVFASASMSLADYYKKNAMVCNELQETANMPIKFRVTV